MSSQRFLSPVSSADHIIEEYGETDPITRSNFPDSARQTIENDINQGEDDRLKIEWLQDGRVRIHATSYVGLISLPGGLTIEIRPKVEGTDLLDVLQYSQGIEADTIEQETELREGNEFIQALATLFESELAKVIQRGLSREYQRHSDIEKHVRGRIAVQRQLQRHGPQPIKFECTYDNLTQNTVLNQAVLHATDILLGVVGNREVGKSLQRHKQVLQRSVESRPVRPVELEAVELSRLSTHYEDLYRLTMLVLKGIYADNLRAGSRSSYSLLVDMNSIFESVVERGLKDLFEDTSIDIQTQATKRDLFWGGSRSIQIRPDVLAFNGQHPLFVGDAKWKVDTNDSREPSTGDLYQLLAYQVAHNTLGILFYPAQNDRVSSTYHSELGQDLDLVEVPTVPAEGRSYEETVRKELTHSLPKRVTRFLK